MTSVSDVLGDDAYLKSACPNLYVAFQAQHFKRASVIWLNERYWCSQGLRLGDVNVRSDLIHSLLARFGVSTYGDFDSDETYLTSSATLYADRYGGTFGHNHGGSGRAGTIGRFNAKGVGATPLKDPAADWYHSHGCMWLEEAIREAIFSELAWRSFPERANPIVAIIDTGENVRSASGDPGARRAIAVRPAALRVAHLQRNILFGDAGHEASDQYRDTLRVGEVIGHVASTRKSGGLVATIMAGLCRQVGFGRAHRLFHGDYISSNVCVSGALLDFGAFRGVEDWGRRQWEENALPFGAEAGRLLETSKSLSFYVRKHLGPGDETDPVDFAGMEDKIDEEFRKHLSDMLGPHPRAATIVARLQEVFEIQQAREGTEAGDWDSLARGLDGDVSDPPSQVGRLGAAIVSDLNGSADQVRAMLASARIRRWAAPYGHASREAVSQRIEAMLVHRGGELSNASVDDDAAPPPSWLADFIAASVNGLRRSYPDHRCYEVILGEETVARCLVVTCRNVATGSLYWRVEGPGTGHELLAGGAYRAPPVGSQFYDAGPGQTAFVTTSKPPLSTWARTG